MASDKMWTKMEKGVTYIDRFAGETEGFLLDYDNDNGLFLYVLLQNPSEEEVKMITDRGKIEFYFTEMRGCGIMGVKFEGYEYGDCPFEPRLYENKLDFPELTEKQGLALTIVLVDTIQNGMVAGLRAVGLGHDFSNKFIKWCKETEEKPFDLEKYNQTMDAIFKAYSSKELAKYSMCKYVHRPM